MDANRMELLRVDLGIEFMKQMISYHMNKEELALGQYFSEEQVIISRFSFSNLVPGIERVLIALRDGTDFPYIPRRHTYEQDILRVDELLQVVHPSDTPHGFAYIRSGPLSALRTPDEEYDKTVGKFNAKMASLKKLRTKVGRMQLIHALMFLERAIYAVMIDDRGLTQWCQTPQKKTQFIDALERTRNLIISVAYDWSRSLEALPIADEGMTLPDIPSPHSILLEGFGMGSGGLPEAPPPPIEKMTVMIEATIKEYMQNMGKGPKGAQGVSAGQVEAKAKEVAKKILDKDAKDEFGETKAQRERRVKEWFESSVDPIKFAAEMNTLLANFRHIPLASEHQQFKVIPSAKEYLLIHSNFRMSPEARGRIIPTVANYRQLIADCQEKAEMFGTDLQRPDLNDEEGVENLMARYLFNGEELQRLNNYEDQVHLTRQLVVLIGQLQAILKELKAGQKPAAITQLTAEGHPEMAQISSSPQFVSSLDNAIQTLMITCHEWVSSASAMGKHAKKPRPSSELWTQTKRSRTIPTPPPSPPRPSAGRPSKPSSQMRKEIESVLYWGPHSALAHSVITPPGIFRHVIPDAQRVLQQISRSEDMSRIQPTIPSVFNYFDVVIDQKLSDYLGTPEGRIAIVKELMELIKQMEAFKQALRAGGRVGGIEFSPDQRQRTVAGLPAAIGFIEKIACDWARSIDSIETSGIRRPSVPFSPPTTRRGSMTSSQFWEGQPARSPRRPSISSSSSSSSDEEGWEDWIWQYGRKVPKPAIVSRATTPPPERDFVWGGPLPPTTWKNPTRQVPPPTPPQPRPPTGQPRPPTGQPRPPTGQPRPPTGQPRPPTGQPRPPTGQPRPPPGQQRPRQPNLFDMGMGMANMFGNIGLGVAKGVAKSLSKGQQGSGYERWRPPPRNPPQRPPSQRPPPPQRPPPQQKKGKGDDMDLD